MPNGTYGIGANIDIGITFYRPDGRGVDMNHATSGPLSPVNYGPLDHTYLDLTIPGRSAEFLSKQSGNVLIYRYVVQPGDASADLGYTNRHALHAPSLLGRSTSGLALCYLPDPSAPGSLRSQFDVAVDGIVPRVLNVTSDTPSGTYGAESSINITVTFDEPVVYSGDAPLLLRMATGGEAAYASGNGTSALRFAYTVRGGDSSAGLDYAGPMALSSGGMLTDVAGNPANLTLPGPGANGSLVAPQGIAIDTSASTAYATSVSSPDANGTRAAGAAVNITVAFNRAVAVAGEPRLGLATAPPRDAVYVGGSATAELEFRYVVQPGDSAASLDYANASAMSLGAGASVRDLADSTDAALALAPPGAPGSLDHSRDIAIDGVAPRLLGSTSPNRDGTYGTGRIVGIEAVFSEPIDAEGEPAALELATAPPRNATYAGGSGTDRLSFLYAVQPGDSADDLGYAGTGALFLNGSTIRDLAGNEAAGPLSLPPARAPGSLAASKDIAIHGAALPVLAAAGSAADGQDGFDALRRAHGVAAFEMGGRAYAVVASVGDDGLQLVRIHENGTLRRADSLPDDDSLALGEANAVDAFEMGNRTYAIAVSWPDHGAQLVRIHVNGTLSAYANGSATNGTGGFDTLAGPLGVDAFAVGDRTYAAVASGGGNGVQLIRVHGNGTLKPADSLSLSDDPGLVLGGARGIRAFETADNRTYAAVAASTGHGVQLVRIHGNGTLEAAGSLADNGTLRLNGARGVDVIEASDNRTYAVVASYGENGVQLVRIHGNGTLEAAGSLGSRAGVVLGGAAAADAFEMGNRTYAVVASYLGNGVQLVRIGAGGDVFADGSAADGADFPELYRAYGIDTFEMGSRTYAIVSSEHDHGVQLIRLSPASVTDVSPLLPDGTYPAGYRIRIAVGFDAPVSVSGPPPSLALDLGDGRHRTAEYVSGSGTRSLVFEYTARPGDDTGGLDYAGAGALTTRGAVTDLGAAGALAAIAANLELPDTGDPGSPGGLRGVKINTAPVARVANISSPNANGTYAPGDTVEIAVRFTDRVAVTGAPVLELATSPPRNATYASGSGTAELTFLYRVIDGDSAARLDYAGTAALVLPRGSEGGGGGVAASIADTADGRPAFLGLPYPGDRGSLGHSKYIEIDGVAPSVLRVSSPNRDGTYGTGRIVNVTVAFDEPVVLAGGGAVAGAGAGVAALELATSPPRNATYASGNGTSVLSFLYAVRPGDSAEDLGYAGTGALRLNDTAISDALGNEAGADRLPLPAPRTAGSLAASKDIKVHGAALPVLAPTGWAADGRDGADQLHGARAVAAFEMEGRPHVIATSDDHDNGVQLLRVREDGGLDAAGSLADNGTLKLGGARGVDVIEAAGNRTYAIVASYGESGVQLVRIHGNGTLEAAGSLADNGTLRLGGAWGVAAYKAGDRTYAAVGSEYDGGVQLVRIHGNGTLEAAGSLADNGTLRLGSTRGVDVIDVGNRTYAIVASYSENGVQLVRIHGNGTLEADPAGQLGDTYGRELGGASGVAAYEAGGPAYAVVGSEGDQGVQLVRIGAGGTLQAAGALAYRLGIGLDRVHYLDVFGTGGRMYALVTSLDSHGVQLVRIHGNGMLEAAGYFDATDGARLLGSAGVATFEADGRVYAAVAANEHRSVQLIRLSPASVTGVSSPQAGGTYPAGHQIRIAVGFDAQVSVSGPPPSLELDLGGGRHRTAEYVSGSGTRTLVFEYTARPGDDTGGLDYAGAGALTTRGIVTDMQAGGNDIGTAADLELPAPGSPGSLGGMRGIGIDTTSSARVSGVSSPGADGTYASGDTVEIAVRFTEAVDVAGEPVLMLATSPPRNATYASGSGTAELTFLYRVIDGDSAARLDYAGTAALVLPRGSEGGGGGGAAASIAGRTDGRPAVLGLPAPGTDGSLGHSKYIEIDGVAPSVLRVTSPDPDGTYGTGRIVNITVAFDTPVIVAAGDNGGGAPVLGLATSPPRNATYASGSGTAELSFLYAVRPGDSAEDLGYAGTGALRLNGAAISDALGNEAGADRLSLPAPRTADSLAASKDIGIRGAKMPVLAAAGHSSPSPSPSLQFASAHRPAVFEAGNGTYAVVTSYGGDAAMLARVHGNGTLEELDMLTKAGDNSPLGGAIGADAFKVDNRTYAIVASSGDDAVVLLEAHLGNGTLREVANIRDTTGRNLLNAIGVDAFEMDGRTYVAVASNGDHAVVLLEVRPGSGGTLREVDEITWTNNNALMLEGAADVAVFDAGDRTYAAVTARDGGGVQLVQIHGNGTLEADPAHQLVDNGTLALGSPLAIDVFKMGDSTYAMAASDRNDFGVQLVRIRENGTLEAAGTLADTGALRLGEPTGIDAFEMGGAAYAIVAARSDDGVQLVRVHDDDDDDVGTLEAAGSAANGAVFPALEGAYGAAVFSMGGRTYAMVASADGGESSGVQLIRLSPASVTGVSSPQAGGTYPAGHQIRIAVGFDAQVSVSGPPPSLELDLGGGRHRTAEYVSGSGTRSLVFEYTARPGDDTGGLDYAGAGALTTRGIVTDMQAGGDDIGTAADLELPAPGSPGSLGGMRGIGIDTASSARVSGVSSPGADGTYASGDIVEIAVRFTEAVDVAGEPVLMLATSPPRNATYASGSGTAELTFLYRVIDGDSAARLDYAGTAALVLPRGSEGGGGAAASIAGRTDGRPAVLGLPAPGTDGSLGHSKYIEIDGVAPSVLRVTSPDPDGTYGTGRIVNITVAFDTPVVVAAGDNGGGVPVLGLAASPPRNATYASGSGTAELSFLYAVRPGDSADDLGYAGGTAALRMNGAAIGDLVGNAANLSLPAPGLPDSLDGSKDIAIRGAKLPILAPAGHLADNQTLGLSMAQRPAIFEAGNSTYAVVTSYGDGVELLQVREDGTLSHVGALRVHTGPVGVDVFPHGDSTYAVVATHLVGSVRLLALHPGNGTIAHVASVAEAENADALELAGAIGVDVFAMGGRTYAAVASIVDDGVQLLEVRPGDRTLSAVSQIDAASAPGPGGAADVAVFETGGRTYAMVASTGGGGGVQTLRVHANGTLEHVHRIGGGGGGGGGAPALGGAVAIDVFKTGDSTYAMVAASAVDGVQLVLIHGNGTIEAAGSAFDGMPFGSLGNPHGVDAFEMGGEAYAIVAARDSSGVQLVRIRADSTLDAAGSAALGAEFPELEGAHGVEVFATAGRTYALVASTGGGGGAQSIRLSPASVAGVETTLAPGALYTAGHRFNVTVAFDGPVILSGPPPSLLLDLGPAAPRAAGYLSGNGTSSLVFSYTVRPGDASSRLEYAGSGALVTRGIVYDLGAAAAPAPAASGAAAADLELPPTGLSGPLGALGVRIDARAPSVQGVSFLNKSGTYGAGSAMGIAVKFDERVLVAGQPRLALAVEPPASASYHSGNGSDTLVFLYTVRSGDSADPLEYGGRGALSTAAAPGSAIRDDVGHDADLVLPPAGSPGSLGALGVRIDARAPYVLGAAALNASGTYGAGDRIAINVTFSEPVVVAGTPLLALDAGDADRRAAYAAGNSSAMLTFLYTVQDGDASAGLDYAGTTALTLGGAGGSIRDAAGNGAVLELPEPGGEGSLAGSAIVIDADGTAVAPAHRNATVVSAAFTARNTATITYSGALDRPDGHEGAVYESVSVEGGYTARIASGNVSGLGGATHAIRFGGAGVDSGQAGTVALASELAGAAAADGAALRFAEPSIRVAPGETVRVVGQHEPPAPGAPPPPPVAIERDGFARAVNATGAGNGARVAINVTGLAAQPGAAGTAGNTAEFPAEAVRLIAAFAEVTFPANATASPVPAGGLIALYASDEAPPNEDIAAALGLADAGSVRVRQVVEIGDPATHIVFDAPVRILLVGQAGGSGAFYANSTDGSVVPIVLQCVADSTEGALAQLQGSGECWIDTPAGGKVIHTYHLTRFGTAEAADGPPRPPPRPGAPEPVSVSVLQRAGGDLLRAPALYTAGQSIAIAVDFSAPVSVGGAPRLLLDTGSAGAAASYASGSGTGRLEFSYAVRGGDITNRLSYAGTGALVLGGGSITAAGQGAPVAASVALPPPGAPGSLSGPGSPAVRIEAIGRPVLDVGMLDEAGPAGFASRAAYMAAAEFNERQGRTDGALLVNVSAYDAGGATAGSAAEALRSAHSSGAGPSVYVGPSTDRGLHAAMPYAAENNMVLVSAGSTAPSLAVEGDTVFRLLPSDRLEAEALVRLAYSGGDESVHAVIDNATYGPLLGGALDDAVLPPPQGGFFHAFGAALASAAISPLSSTVALDAAAADDAAAALDASVRSAGAGGSPVSVVYLGSPEGLAALAESSASYPALASASWFASGLSAGSALLAGDGPAAGFAADTGLAAPRWSPPASDAGRQIDSRLPGMGPGERNGAYAAYDAVLVLGAAAAAAASASGGRGGGTTDAAAIAEGLPGAAAGYSGALGDIALDYAGDLWVPAKYDLWTAARPGGAGTATEWEREPGDLDGERACSITLTRARIDYGPIDSGQTSRPHLQTVVNTGQLSFAQVDLTATPWHVDSPGGCAPGSQPSLPVGLSEIRTELGGDFSNLAASGTTLARGLEAGSQAPVWYRLSLTGYADLPQAQITQCATYVVRCS